MYHPFWRIHRNKTFAVCFSTLAVFSFIVAYLIYGIGFGFQYLVASPFTIINLVLTLIILVMLLITNIQNDNRAFAAIMMLFFLMVWDMIISWLPGGANLGSAFGGNPGAMTLAIIMLVAAAGAIAVGVVAFIFLFRYRVGRASFEKTMLFSYILVGCFSLEQILEIVLVVMLIGFEPYSFVYYLLSNLSLVFAGVACLFTLRRLRR